VLDFTVLRNDFMWASDPCIVSLTSSMSKKRVKKFSDAKTSIAKLSAPKARVKVDPIETLVLGLKNHEVMCVSEVKGSAPRMRIPEEKVLEARTLLRSFFPAGKTYRFRMTATFALTTNGGGVILGFQSFSPAVSSYNEWTALSALFDEVRGIKVHCTMVSSFGGTSTAIVLPICFAPDYSNINTTPASAAIVNRLAESDIVVGGLLTNNKPRCKTAILPSDVAFCDVATPATVSPYAGLVGAWVFAGQIIAGTPSITYFYCFMDTLAAFRMRA